jgi:altronate hydrolase
MMTTGGRLSVIRLNASDDVVIACSDTERERGEMNNNPSPGNKAGGLTTILEKSLGAVAKGGTTNLVDVVKYAEPVGAKGLVFMDTSGYDPVSATGQVAGGSNLICFTTGRGSVYGCKPAPLCDGHSN